MELRQLRYFAKTAELLNFTQAAEQLRVAQPALSRTVSGLETELGVKLLERNSRRVALTEAGRALLEDVREILDLVEAVEARIKRVQRDATHVLRLGFAPQLTSYLVPGLVRSLKERRLKIRFELRDMANEEMISGIRDRSLDLALVPSAAVPRNRSFVVRNLAVHKLELIVPVDHRLAGLKTVPPQKIAGETLLGYDRRQYSEYAELLKKVFKQARLPLLVAAEFDAGSSLFSAVQSGAGVAIVTSDMSKTGYPGVQSIPLAGTSLRVEIGLLHHRDLPPQIALPLETICSEIATAGTRPSTVGPRSRK